MRADQIGLLNSVPISEVENDRLCHGHQIVNSKQPFGECNRPRALSWVFLGLGNHLITLKTSYSDCTLSLNDSSGDSSIDGPRIFKRH